MFPLGHLSGKTIKHNKELNLILVDQEKAFDQMDRNRLWQSLENYSIRGQLLDNIRTIYANNLSTVRTHNGLMDCFRVSSGVRQGCVLSPLLFIIYMDRITMETEPNPEYLNEMFFADDQSLVHEKEEHLQEHTNSPNRECKELNMKISISKTEVMKISRNPGNLNVNIK